MSVFNQAFSNDQNKKGFCVDFCLWTSSALYCTSDRQSPDNRQVRNWIEIIISLIITFDVSDWAKKALCWFLWTSSALYCTSNRHVIGLSRQTSEKLIALHFGLACLSVDQDSVDAATASERLRTNLAVRIRLGLTIHQVEGLLLQGKKQPLMWYCRAPNISLHNSYLNI